MLTLPSKLKADRFGSFWTVRRTLAGYEAMAMIRTGQVRNIGSGVRAQVTVIAELFQVTA